MTRRSIGTWLLFTLSLTPAAAQTTTVAADPRTRARLDTLLTAAAGTPGGQGLVPTALGEGRIALTEAVRAAEASRDLAAMQAAAGRVLQAVDPARGNDPAAGYGVTRALAAIVREVQLTAAADQTRAVAVAAPQALAAAKQAQGAAAALVLLAERLLAAGTAAEAAPLARELAARAGELLAGVRSVPAARRLAPSGGLLAIHAHLSAVQTSRTGTLPAALREARPR